MPEWNGVERRTYEPVRPPIKRLIGSLAEFGRKLWLDYLRRGIARPGELATMAAELRATRKS